MTYRALIFDLFGTPMAASSDVKTEFDRIHRRSVQLNGAVLLGNLVIVGIVASRLRY